MFKIQNEHTLQKIIVNYCKFRNVLIFETDIMDGLKFLKTQQSRLSFIKYHTQMGYIKGQSDLVVILKNKILFVELKTEKGKQSKEQKAFEKNVKELGHDYYIIRNLEEFEKLINMYKNM